MGYNLESVLNFIKQVNSLLLRLVSASLRLFSASIHFGNLKIARYSLHPQNENLLKNSPQIISNNLRVVNEHFEGEHICWEKALDTTLDKFRGDGLYFDVLPIAKIIY